MYGTCLRAREQMRPHASRISVYNIHEIMLNYAVCNQVKNPDLALMELLCGTGVTYDDVSIGDPIPNLDRWTEGFFVLESLRASIVRHGGASVGTHKRHQGTFNYAIKESDMAAILKHIHSVLCPHNWNKLKPSGTLYNKMHNKIGHLKGFGGLVNNHVTSYSDILGSTVTGVSQHAKISKTTTLAQSLKDRYGINSQHADGLLKSSVATIPAVSNTSVSENITCKENSNFTREEKIRNGKAVQPPGVECKSVYNTQIPYWERPKSYRKPCKRMCLNIDGTVEELKDPPIWNTNGFKSGVQWDKLSDESLLSGSDDVSPIGSSDRGTYR